MTLPRITILEALKLHLIANTPMVDGVPMFKVRHERFRAARFDEMPCVSIRYLGDDAPNVTRGAEDAANLSLAESAMELRVSLIIDLPLPPEMDEETAGDPGEGDDPTGLEQASAIVEACLGAIFREGEEIDTMGGVIWDAIYDGTGDNDDLESPDNVRMAENLTLVYRVRAEAPHKLLIGE